MMAFRINWEGLTKLKADLTQRGFTQETPLIVIVSLQDGTHRKNPVRFKNFLQFMWSLSEIEHTSITRLAVQDPSGRVVYRQRRMTAANEELPEAKGGLHLENWQALTPHEKDLYVRLTIAQIDADGR